MSEASGEARVASKVNKTRPKLLQSVAEMEDQFGGRDNRKFRYAVMAAAAVHGGAELDLLEEVAYWATDDFWSYAGLAAVAWARAVADQRGIAFADLCARLRARASTAKHAGR